MSPSDIFIRRPVLSTVLALMILLLGFQGLFNLTVRQYPEVEETVITITTAYPGASAASGSEPSSIWTVTVLRLGRLDEVM